MPYNIKILQPPSLLDLPQNFLSLSIFPSRFLKIRSVVSSRNPGDNQQTEHVGEHDLLGERHKAAGTKPFLALPAEGA